MTTLMLIMTDRALMVAKKHTCLTAQPVPEKLPPLATLAKRQQPEHTNRALSHVPVGTVLRNQYTWQHTVAGLVGSRKKLPNVMSARTGLLQTWASNDT